MGPIILSLTLFHCLPALADTPEVNQEMEEPQVQLEAKSNAQIGLEADMHRVAAELAEATSGLEHANLVIDATAKLIDIKESDETKIAAIETLKSNPEPRVLPFIEAVAHGASVELKLAIISSAETYASSERMAEIIAYFVKKRGSTEVRVAAIGALSVVSYQDTFELLWTVATTGKTDNAIHDAAAKALMDGYADQVEAAGGLVQLSPSADILTIGITGTANAVVGGVLLHSVGMMGSTEIAPGVGAVGGTIIGGATGSTYAYTKKMPLENAAQYASGVGWGVISSTTLNNTLGIEGDSRGGAAIRSLGVAAGATGAFYDFGRKPSIDDTLEVNGGAIALGAFASSATNYGFVLARDDNSSSRNRQSALSGAWLGGSMAGLGAGYMLAPHVEFDSDDAVFVGSSSLGSIWLSTVGTSAFGGDVHGEMVATAFWGTMLGSAAGSQFHNVPAKTTLSSAYGWASGNLIGLGIAGFTGSKFDDAQHPALGALFGGLGGGAIGAISGPSMAFDTDGGDAVMVAASTIGATYQSAVLGYILSEKTGFEDTGALVLTTSGATALGTAFLAQKVDLDLGQPLFVTSAGAWGLFYGGLIPVATDWELDGADYALELLIVTDLFAATGAYMVSDAGGIDPVQTVIPQVTGVAGASLATLGTAMATANGQSLSQAALAGSVAGMGIGVLIEKKYGHKILPRVGSILPLSEDSFAVLEKVQVMASPTVLEDGSTGIWLQLGAHGW